MDRVPLEDWKQVISPAVNVYFGTSKEDGRESVPKSVLPTLTMLAASIKKCASGMGQWSTEALTFGLYKVAAKHALKRDLDTIGGDIVKERLELEEILHWLRWAMAAYEKERSVLATNLGIDSSHVLKHVTKSELIHPAYYIAVDEVKSCIVFGVRGTVEIYDILTDLTPHSEAFEGGYAHSGMLKAAKWLLEKEESFIRNKMQEHPDFKLIIAGHSLGAGTAALMSMILRERVSLVSSENNGNDSRLRINASRISAWCFACPPSVNLQLAKSSNFIRSVILHDDIVARASAAALEDLRNEILKTDWSCVMQEGSLQKEVMDLVQSSSATISKLGPVLGIKREEILSGTKNLGTNVTNAIGNQMKRQMELAQKGEYGIGWQRTACFFSVASNVATAFTSVLAEKAMEKIQEAEQHPSFQAYPSANKTDGVSAFNSGTRERNSHNLEHAVVPRLHVPGILYHIIRQPLEPGEVPPLTIEEMIQIQKSKDEDNKYGSRTTKKTEIEYWFQEEKQLEQEGVKMREDKNNFFWFMNLKTEAEKNGRKNDIKDNLMWDSDDFKSGAVACDEHNIEDRSSLEHDGNEQKDMRTEGIMINAGFWGMNNLVSLFSKRKGKEVEEEDKKNESTMIPKPNSYSKFNSECTSSNPISLSSDAYDNKLGDGAHKGNRMWVNYPTLEEDSQKKNDGERNSLKVVKNEDKGTGEKQKKGKENVKYVVVRGNDPNSRFQRIIFSQTMFSDHACGEYGDGVINALQWSYH